MVATMQPDIVGDMQINIMFNKKKERSKKSMIRKLARSIREYKKYAILTFAIYIFISCNILKWFYIDEIINIC